MLRTRKQTLDFKNEKYILNKDSLKDKWLIVEYIKGKKPSIYSLVDYYTNINESSSSTSLDSKNLSFYENNPDYFIKDIDINNDGLLDKIISHNKNMGDDMLFFLNNGKSNYIFKLKTHNFTEDGGYVMGDIFPLNSKTSNNVFYINTYFDGSGGAQKQQFISYKNNNWYLAKTLYITSNWQKNPDKEYHCEITQNIDLNDKNIIEKLKPVPDESSWDKVCTVENISNK